MPSEAVSLRDALRSAFEHMLTEARAEVAEHEEHVAEAKRRLLNLQHLLAVLDRPAATEPCL